MELSAFSSIKRKPVVIFWLLACTIVFVWSFIENFDRWWPNGLWNDDINREVATPLRLNHGEVLYEDFNFVYPPLPQYINAWLIKAFPFKPINTLRAVALIAFLLGLGITVLVCMLLGVADILAPVLFISLCWGVGNGTAFNPTAFNGVYSGILASISLLFGLYSQRTQNVWPWLGLGLCAGLVILCKPEGVFGLALVVPIVLLLYWKQHRRRILQATLALSIGGLLGAVPFSIFLLYQELTFPELLEGILQRRFQQNLSQGFIEAYNYFFGINGVIVIASGLLACVILILFLRFWEGKKKWSIALALGAAVLVGLLLIVGKLPNFTNDFVYIGGFFGGIVGYWWVRQLNEHNHRNMFLIFWMASFGGWLRPLFHIGALVIPFRTGGSLMAVIFWIKMMPFLFRKIYPDVIIPKESVSRFFGFMGASAALIYGLTGLWFIWHTEWQYPKEKVATPYGSFTVKADSSWELWNHVRTWLRENTPKGKRFVAIEGLNLELAMGFLPCLPISQANYQFYEGDEARTINVLEKRRDIQYVIVPIRHRRWHFGIQAFRLADYLDTHWKQVARFDVPESLTTLAMMSPERKLASGLEYGIIIYGRHNLSQNN